MQPSSRLMRGLIGFGCFLLILGSALAQDAGSISAKRLPKGFLKNTRPLTAPTRDRRTAKTGLDRSAFASLQGYDTIQNWSGQFDAQGYDYYGNPQSVWPYYMIGNPPESNRTTLIPTPVFPLTVRLLDASGQVARDPATGTRLIQTDTPEIIDGVLHSPMFEAVKYNSGTGQFNDEMQRAEFWNRIHHGDRDDDSDGWHTVMKPSLKRGVTISIPYGLWYYTLNDDNSCCLSMLVDFDTFFDGLFPPSYPFDNSTPIGAAELAGEMRTKDLSSFVSNNVFLYVDDVKHCCVLGFHNYDYEPGTAENGNLPRIYVMAYGTWISPGMFFRGTEDIIVFSHEFSEAFNDPFANNETPWTLSEDPYTGVSLCGDLLETGDQIVPLTTTFYYSIAHHNRTYHVQNEALLPWFAFAKPSPAPLHAYSFPDETTLPSLSAADLKPNCQP